MGIPFTHLESSDFSAQSQCLLDYCQQQNIDQIFANQEVELNERLRDDALSKQNILTLHFFESDVMVAKGAVLNGQGEMYKVFTPFKKAWATHLMRTYQSSPTIGNHHEYLAYSFNQKPNYNVPCLKTRL